MATSRAQSALNPFSTYVHIEDGGRATVLEVTETFWKELVTGNRPELNAGWLLAAYRMSADTPTWEMHPAGDEILYLLSGAIDVVLQEEDGERVIELRRESGLCVVPRGAWHRQIVREPGDLLGLTCGKGTEHRPVQ